YRFERGCDPGVCDWASQRTAQLILETAGGTLAEGVVDAYPKPVEPKQISLRPHKVKELLGIDVSPEQMETYLGQLELKVVGRKPRPVDAPAGPPEPVSFRIPTFRVDLKQEVDLIEEIARLYGVDRIPATPPRGASGANAYDSVHDQLVEARRILTGLGLQEAQGQTLISSSAATMVGCSALIRLANPLSSDMDVLRPSLLPGLLDALRHNINRKTYDAALFELGRVFQAAQATGAQSTPPAGVRVGNVREERRIAMALTGQRHPLFWSGVERDAKFDAYDLKGILEEFLQELGLRGLNFVRRTDASSLFLESATVQLGKFQLGEFGQLLPPVAKQYDLRDAVFLAEL